MKKTAQTSIVLNALALAGMLVFASQAANAAPTRSPSVDTQTTANAPTPKNVQNTPTVTDSTPDIADTHEVEVENAGDIGDIGNQDIETPDIANVEVPELETPDSN